MENVHPIPAFPLPTVTRVKHCITVSGLPAIEQGSRLDRCGLMNVVHSYKHLLTHGSRAGRTASIAQRKAGTLDNDEFELPIGYTSTITPQSDGTTELHIHIIQNTAARAIIRSDISESDEVTNGIIITSAEPSNVDDYTQPSIETDTTTSTKPYRPFRINADWMHLLSKANAPQPKKEPPIRPGFREMTPAEVAKYLDLYCGQCAKSIEDYLYDIYTKAIQDGVQPDYLGLPSQYD